MDFFGKVETILYFPDKNEKSVVFDENYMYPFAMLGKIIRGTSLMILILKFKVKIFFWLLKIIIWV